VIAALALGSGTALAWAVMSLLSAPASRLAGPAQALLWTSLIGMLAAAALAIPGGLPDARTEDWLLMLVAGVAYLGGTGLFLLAVSTGNVSLVTPIVACDGAIGTVMAAAAGAPLPAVAALAMGVMFAGIVLITRARPAVAGAAEARFAPARMRPVGQTVAIAAASATSFGVVFLASGGIEGISALWVVACARAFPTLGGLAVCLRQGGVLPPRTAWRWLAGVGLLDALGYLVYVWAARSDRAIAPVAASQYAALGAIGAVLLLRERLSRSQVGGVVALLAGIALIAARGTE
jgi:uncharacterized membrane protein